MSIILKTPSNGSVTLAEQDTASDVVVTVPARAGKLAVDGPAFSAYQSATQTQIAAATQTKILFQTEEFDTNNCFDSSRFTPNVAGYYQINGGLVWSSTVTQSMINIYKNGSAYKRGQWFGGGNGSGSVVSSLVYLNGTTDYIEIYGFTSSAQSPNPDASTTYFNGAMMRAA